MMIIRFLFTPLIINHHTIRKSYIPLFHYYLLFLIFNENIRSMRCCFCCCCCCWNIILNHIHRKVHDEFKKYPIHDEITKFVVPQFKNGRLEKLWPQTYNLYCSKSYSCCYVLHPKYNSKRLIDDTLFYFFNFNPLFPFTAFSSI